MTSSQQGFPQINGPFLDDEGRLSHPWHRFLISLWQKVGGAVPTLVNGVYFLYQAASGLSFYSVSSGEKLGQVALTAVGGGKAQVIPLGTSPTTYEAPTSGFAVVTSAQIEIGRQGDFFVVSPMGGAVPMVQGDTLRLTWYGPALPTAHFLPNS